MGLVEKAAGAEWVVEAAVAVGPGSSHPIAGEDDWAGWWQRVVRELAIVAGSGVEWLDLEGVFWEDAMSAAAGWMAVLVLARLPDEATVGHWIPHRHWSSIAAWLGFCMVVLPASWHLRTMKSLCCSSLVYSRLCWQWSWTWGQIVFG